MEKTVETLNELLNKGVVKFSYKKKNGEVRNAIGTKNFDYVSENFGEEMLPKGGHIYTDEVIRYFDTNSEGWRSFRKENFLDYEESIKSE